MNFPAFPVPARRPAGFTLVEQIATLAVAAILVTMAIPSMARLATRSDVRTTEDALFTAAHLARSSAIMHNTHALLCPSVDGSQCSAGPDWQQGWIVALDGDHDNQPDGGILFHGQPTGGHVRVVGSNGHIRVRFRADGDAAGTNLSLVICPRQSGHARARVIVISNAGRIREAMASKAQRARCPDAA